MDLGFVGYEVLATAANGKDAALQMAMTGDPRSRPLDIMMPYIDGYHVAYELTNKLAQGPRIVIMTSRDTVKEKASP